MARRPLADIDKLMRFDRSQRILETWTPDGWVPDNDASWTGMGGSADWEDLTEKDAQAVIAGFKTARSKGDYTYTVSHDGEVQATGLTTEELYQHARDHEQSFHGVCRAAWEG
jgi:hypothetical protein